MKFAGSNKFRFLSIQTSLKIKIFPDKLQIHRYVYLFLDLVKSNHIWTVTSYIKIFEC